MLQEERAYECVERMHQRQTISAGCAGSLTTRECPIESPASLRFNRSYVRANVERVIEIWGALEHADGLFAIALTCGAPESDEGAEAR